jgi:EAL and modified HD-GYP domain-containing signal transduction protein
MPQIARFARTAPSTVPPSVVSRQPILDRSESIGAYELLAPPSDADPRSATSTILVEAIADIGLSRLVGNRPAHVDVTREFLLAVRPLPLVPERVVLEIAGDRPADDALLMVAREARDAGFKLALDHYQPGAGADALLDVASMVKLDFGLLDFETVPELRRRGLTLIATGVETRETYRICHELRFDGFQGSYFAEPVVLTGTAPPTYRLRALSMLVQDGDMTTFEQLERVIAEDPGLSLKLMKLANSAFYGGREPVGSIRQALLALGSIAVRRWATLFMLAGVSDRPNDLLEVGLLRARLCELVASRNPHAEADRAFTVGLFSVVDALLGTRMPALLEDLPFDERTKHALGSHEGPEGRILGGVLAYERGDFEGCARHGVGLADIALAYREALDWSNGALMQLTA